MSLSGGVSIARNRGENRFYNPPHVRQRQQQQQREQVRQQQEKHRKPSTRSSSAESEKRAGSDGCASLSSSATTTTKSDCSVSESGLGLGESEAATNLDRFLEHTTPIVPAHYFPETSVRRWRTRKSELHPYFVLGDLWDSFKEWSAYGAGVPLLLNGSDSVVQYYVPYLSAIQLYIDPSKSSPSLRRPGEESDSMSSRESSSDSCSDHGAERGANNVIHGTQLNTSEANIEGLKRVSLRNKGSSSDENENCNPSGRLEFKYLEHDPPFSREPLADKIAVLAPQFPALRTYKSSDLSPSRYPIYRIPTGPTLQNLDACFLTFHSLSTTFKLTNSVGMHFHGPRPKEIHSADLSVKL